MRRYIFTIILGIVFSMTAFSQKTVAVYVTASEGVLQETKKILGSELVAAITKTADYVAVERTADFMAQVLQEQGNYEIDDAALYDLGRKFGASNVCVADITKFDDDYYIVARLLDVKTSKVWKTSRNYSKLKSLQELIETSEKLAENLFGSTKAVSSYAYGDNVDNNSFIVRIENRENYTKVTVKYLSVNTKQKISINQATYIEDMTTHQKYKLVDAANINITDYDNNSGKNIGKGIWEYYLFFERIPEETHNVRIVEPNGRKYNDIVLKPYGDDDLFVFEDNTQTIYQSLLNAAGNNSYEENENTQYKENLKLQRLKYKEQIREKRRLARKESEEDFAREFGNYYSIFIGYGISYGGLGIGFTKRMQWSIGFEPLISIGYLLNTNNESGKSPVGYAVGVNCFYYKGLYVGSLYGIHDYTVDGDECKGLSFVLGWKCYLPGGYLDFAAGCKMHSNDTEKLMGFDVVSPAWNIGLGIFLSRP